MAQKRKLELVPLKENIDAKRRKLVAPQKDSDPDFDPLEIVQDNEQRKKKKKHRYRTRSRSRSHRKKSTNENKETEHEENKEESEMKQHQPLHRKKRGRPKKKDRKRKSNHIEKVAAPNNKKEAIKKRLSSMDKYDSQQYIMSVVSDINRRQYLHPFIAKPTTLPRRRIMKIMKLDPQSCKVSLISLEIMAILIEIFVRDLISKAYKYTTKDNRKSLQLQDICRAVQSDNMYDFLMDIVPRIQSFDQETNIYNFIYTSEMENSTLTNTLTKNVNINNEDRMEDKQESENTAEVSDVANIIRRSKRLKTKRSDKEEAD